jgi:hypothetical protein
VDPLEPKVFMTVHHGRYPTPTGSQAAENSGCIRVEVHDLDTTDPDQPDKVGQRRRIEAAPTQIADWRVPSHAFQYSLASTTQDNTVGVNPGLE